MRYDIENNNTVFPFSFGRFQISCFQIQFDTIDLKKTGGKTAKLLCLIVQMPFTLDGWVINVQSTLVEIE